MKLVYEKSCSIDINSEENVKSLWMASCFMKMKNKINTTFVKSLIEKWNEKKGMSLIFTFICSSIFYVYR